MPLAEFVFILWGTFPKGPVYAKRIFNVSASKLFVGCFECFNILGYLLPEFLPKKIFIFFLKEFRFCF